MAILNIKKDRNVIPNFRSLVKTSELGELDSVNYQTVTPDHNFDGLMSIIHDWKVKPNLAIALDLLNYAFISNSFSDKAVLDAAYFVCKDAHATKKQQDFASRIINKDTRNDNICDDLSFQDFITEEHTQRMRLSIGRMKALLRTNVRNPIAYVELARLYSIVGQKKQAIDSILTAFHLAPHNRYVLRSFIRLAVHYHQEDLALDCLKMNSELVKYDPWILASDIGLSTSLSLPAINAKRGIRMLDFWKGNSFHITELASSIATLELMHGNRKKSRKFFQKAIISPNDNTLAQIEWANGKDVHLNIDVDYSQKNTFYEAKARESLISKSWTDVIKYTRYWFMDQPFSKTPVLIGSGVAGFVYKDYNAAIQFCNAGLLSHPNDSLLLNNMAYYYAMLNNCEIALEYLNNINKSATDAVTLLCAKATRGLIHFRKKEYQQGRALYKEAIETACSYNNDYLCHVAYLNYAREEIMVSPKQKAVFIEQVEKIPDGLSLDIDSLKASVVDANFE